MLQNSENRGKLRDSMFLLADVSVEGRTEVISVRVRNLSAGGMKAEAKPNVVQGDQVIVNLRNIGDVPGTVAWIKPSSFGISFDEPIDPKLARKPVANNSDDKVMPRFVRPIPVKERVRFT